VLGVKIVSSQKLSIPNSR